jgi:hypothetical protein
MDTEKFNSIPRLALSSKRESWDLNSGRSDFEDLFTSTKREDADQTVGIQLDKLNTILETVLNTINNEEISSFLKPSDQTLETSKFFQDSSTQTSLNIQTLTFQESRLKELENSLFSEKFDSLLTFIQKFQETLQKFIKKSEENFGKNYFSSFLGDVLESSLVFTEPVLDFSFKIDSPNISSILQGPSLALEVYRKHLKYLGKHLSNLTMTPFEFSGNFPEQEVPEFVSAILSSFSDVICREKDVELREQREFSYEMMKKLQTTVTFDEIFSEFSRVLSFLQEISETGTDSEFFLNLGFFQVSVQVLARENVRKKIFPKKCFEESLSCSKEELFAEISELKEKVEQQEQDLLSSSQLSENLHFSAQVRIEELESKIDDLMFQLEVKDKLLKNGKNHIGFNNYVDKLQELREKELKLKTGHEKLEAERQKLVKQTIEFLCGKTNSENKQEGFGLKDNRTSQASTQVSVEKESKEAQTDEMNVEESENLEELSLQLVENYSKLEQINENNNCEGILENIKRIKKKINDIHTKQALIFTEKSIDYAESKLKVIEKELKKGKIAKNDEKELKNARKMNQVLAKSLEDLKNLLNHTDLDQERSKFLRERLNFQQQQEKFHKKRHLLKEKIEKVNLRQKKISDLEETLNERKTRLTVQEKKQECFKKAIQEEWGRLDSKRNEVLRCQKLIDEQWKKLLQETESFEDLRSEKGSNMQKTSKFIEKISQIEENALQVEKQQNQVECFRKRLDEEKAKVLEEASRLKDEREKMEREKIEFAKQQKELEIQMQMLNKEKRVLKENKSYINSLVPQLKGFF